MTLSCDPNNLSGSHKRRCERRAIISDEREAFQKSTGGKTYERILGELHSKSLVGIRELTINHLFAHVWNRGVLSNRDRSLITIALLVFQGHKDQLQAHIRGAARRGMGQEEILFAWKSLET